jgi:hypothetical protein
LDDTLLTSFDTLLFLLISFPRYSGAAAVLRTNFQQAKADKSLGSWKDIGQGREGYVNGIETSERGTKAGKENLRQLPEEREAQFSKV